MKQGVGKVGIILVFLSIIILFISTLNDNIVIFGLAFVILGVSILLLVAGNMAVVLSLAIVIGLFFIVFGGLLMAQPLVEHYFMIGERYTLYVVSISVGILFLFGGTFNIIKRFLHCTQVQGLYMGANRLYNRGFLRFSPRFSFIYNNRRYENTSGEVYGKKIAQKYNEGESYPIYISVKNPNIFYTRRKVTITEIAICFLGVLFLLVPFTV